MPALNFLPLPRVSHPKPQVRPMDSRLCRGPAPGDSPGTHGDGGVGKARSSDGDVSEITTEG